MSKELLTIVEVLISAVLISAVVSTDPNVEMSTSIRRGMLTSIRR